MRCYYATGAEDDQAFTRSLEEAALQSSGELHRRGEEDPEYRGMATTLTMFLGVWPKAYLLQVGDSRCYIFRNGELRQLTRDQTMAQALVDIGVLKATDAAATRFARTLSSSIGGRMTDPVVTRLDMAWGTVVLLCSDGLTGHVPDERLRERLRTMTSAQQVCEDLLRDALDAGAERAIIGTAAFRDVDFLDDVIEAFGSRIVVSVDVRGGHVATAGWTQTTGLPATDVIERLQDRGVRAFVYTDADRDGMLDGPALEDVRAVAGVVRGRWIYSGGIGTAEHLRSLARLRLVNLAGVISGKALYEGAFTLAEGQAALQDRGGSGV
jgi:uncharacterized protein related to proFAR isomerase